MDGGTCKIAKLICVIRDKTTNTFLKDWKPLFAEKKK